MVVVLDYCVTEGRQFCSSSADAHEDAQQGEGEIMERKTLESVRSNGPTMRYLSSRSKTNGGPVELDVTFVVTYFAEDYGVQGSKYHEALTLAESQAAEFENLFNRHELQDDVRDSVLSTISHSGGKDNGALRFARINSVAPMFTSSIKYVYEDSTSSDSVNDESTDVLMSNGPSKVLVVDLDESAAQETLVLVPLVLVAIALVGVYGLAYYRRQKNEAFLNTRGAWRNHVFSD